MGQQTEFFKFVSNDYEPFQRYHSVFKLLKVSGGGSFLKSRKSLIDLLDIFGAHLGRDAQLGRGMKVWYERLWNLLCPKSDITGEMNSLIDFFLESLVKKLGS